MLSGMSTKISEVPREVFQDNCQNCVNDVKKIYSFKERVVYNDSDSMKHFIDFPSGLVKV